jgi:DNA-binding NarL/FixJ family response regulator
MRAAMPKMIRLPRVLVVEDNDLLGSAISGALSRVCDVTWVKTIAAAEQEIASHMWDGFLLDVLLPDGSGSTLLAAIRAQHPGEAVVVMSGADPAEHSRDALLHGAMFVAKPLPSNWRDSFFAAVMRGRRGSETELRLRLAALGLSTREVEVLTMLAQGATAATTGLRLGISARTVQAHCSAVYVRLNAGSLTEVLALANSWAER